jgi:hypothetical protein
MGLGGNDPQLLDWRIVGILNAASPAFSKRPIRNPAQPYMTASSLNRRTIGLSTDFDKHNHMILYMFRGLLY